MKTENNCREKDVLLAEQSKDEIKAKIKALQKQIDIKRQVIYVATTHHLPALQSQCLSGAERLISSLWLDTFLKPLHFCISLFSCLHQSIFSMAPSSHFSSFFIYLFINLFISSSHFSPVFISLSFQWLLHLIFHHSSSIFSSTSSFLHLTFHPSIF